MSVQIDRGEGLFNEFNLNGHSVFKLTAFLSYQSAHDKFVLIQYGHTHYLKCGSTAIYWG